MALSSFLWLTGLSFSAAVLYSEICTIFMWRHCRRVQLLDKLSPSNASPTDSITKDRPFRQYVSNQVKEQKYVSKKGLATHEQVLPKIVVAWPPPNFASSAQILQRPSHARHLSSQGRTRASRSCFPPSASPRAPRSSSCRWSRSVKTSIHAARPSASAAMYGKPGRRT